MKTPRADTFEISVPATTSNFGPGFDTFGCALSLYNRVAVRKSPRAPTESLADQAARLVAKHAGVRPFSVEISVRGNVPQARGLGSSVTIRAAVVLAVNHFLGTPLSSEKCLQLVYELEGHPDNATPAFLGGFTICCENKIFQTPVSPALKFVTVVPDFEVRTTEARKLLPKKIPLTEAVSNVRHASILAAAFSTGHYNLLRGAFQDSFHEPYRKKLIPGFDELRATAEAFGALGFFLSGSGSTVIALTDSSGLASRLGKALVKVWRKHGVSSRPFSLTAHNEPIGIL